MFAQMVQQMEPLRACSPLKITQAEFDAWKYGYTFEAVRSIGYGQSFCRRFKIIDYILRFCTDINEADTYIKRTYIR
jgi:hypothetical protein